MNDTRSFRRHRAAVAVIICGLIATTEAWSACDASATPAPICLSGTAIAPGYAAALVAQAGEPGVSTVRQGDMIDGWTVREIGARYIIVEHGETAVRLDMEKDPFGGPAQSLSKRRSEIERGPSTHPRSTDRRDDHE